MIIKGKIKNLIKSIIMTSREKTIIPIVHPIDNNKILLNKVALIAGGTGGIGLAIVKSFVESGCKVILAGTNEKKINRCINQIEDCYASNIKAFILNLGDIQSFDEKIKEASDLFGRIDIFVNAAGVHTDNVDFWGMVPEEYERVMNINLKGPFFICQSIGKYMKEKKIKGHILLISSSRGSEPAWSPYGISKWGLNGLTLGLAKMMLPYGIIVNAIAPGSTATDLLDVKEGDSIYSIENGLERYAMPDEIASYAKLMVSDVGNMIVGETIRISGGRGTIDLR
jgi:NAD(P)-dependent dehydrogenase (short-subunit alcohol dehydrogenase family)